MNYPSRLWTRKDRTGGPIDQVFEDVRDRYLPLIIERIEVFYPADDDNVYFIAWSGSRDCIRIDTGPDGQPPFLIENDGRAETSDSGEAVEIIGRWLMQHRPTWPPPT